MTTWVPVVFSLGANLGDRVATLDSAVAALGADPGITITAVSPRYRTAPVGIVDQPDFINLVALGSTCLNPDHLWSAVSAVEQSYGRQRLVPGGPRTLDIDVVTLGTRVSTGGPLTLPHPRAHLRPFVLVPWLTLDPRAALPGHGPVADLLPNLDTAGVVLIDEAPDLSPSEPDLSPSEPA